MMDTPLALDRATPADLQARRAAEQRGLPFLVFRDNQGAQRIVGLDPVAESLTLGRRMEADVSLPWDLEVSRLHAELECKAGEWLMCDDGFSQNGTFVNGLRIHGRRRLVDGDLVRIGQTSSRTATRRGGTGITMAPESWARRPSSRISSSASCARCASR